MVLSTREKVILADSTNLLIPYQKEKGKYYCPACGGHNLSFHKDGRWNCWNDPSRYHRIEIMKTLFPESGESTQADNAPIHIPRQEENINLYNWLPQIPNSSQIRYPSIVNRPTVLTVRNLTSYYYSDNQRVDRYDYQTSKRFLPKHRIVRDSVSPDNCEWLLGAGRESWSIYGLAGVEPQPDSLNLVLVVEGQKTVEIGLNRHIPTICLEAGDYAEKTIAAKLTSIVSKLNPCLLAILPDNDLTGKLKAAKILLNCINLDIPTVLFNPTDLGYERLGDDLEQLSDFSRDYAIELVHSLFNR